MIRDLEHQMEEVNRLFTEALVQMNGRKRDYAPEGVPLLNVLDSCVKWGVTPLQVLGIAYQKQETALSGYVAGRKLNSESARSRIIDAVNYLALMAYYDRWRCEIHESWREWLEGQPCTCVSRDAWCQRCARLKFVEDLCALD